MADFVPTVGQKFAMLTVVNVYAELPETDTQLPDGTWVLNRVPVIMEKHWATWIGSLRADKMREANLVLLRTVAESSANPDTDQSWLSEHLNKVFMLIQLEGVAEYGEAHNVCGTVKQDGGIQRMGELPAFHCTKGYVRSPIDVARIQQAIKRAEALEQIEGEVSTKKFGRLLRGLKVLRDGLYEEFGQERLHQFVRSLEGLVLPDIGATKNQFVHRCQTFAKASHQSQTILAEAYDMRCDTEHLHEWERTLQTHRAEEREDIALQRTRQMERLASFAYSRILDNKSLWPHFENDSALSAFWKLQEGSRKTAWGTQVDISAIPLVRKYDAWHRAA